MPEESTNGLLWQVRGLVLEGAEAARGDQELLHRYLSTRDEAAFAALVHRHGALVWGVCRRFLHRPADAEDAFQATFLVLARKGAAIRQHASVGSWLHGVACRVARKIRTNLTRREQRSPPARTEAIAGPEIEVSWREVRAVLDEELQRLPEKYRAPLLLCYLEGLTQDEAARRLGWSAGVFRGRLDRGRARLKACLVERGLTLSAGLLGTLAPPVGAAPAPLVVAVVNAAAGRVATSPTVVALTEGVLRAMYLTRLKTLAVVFMMLCLGGLLTGLVARPLSAQDPKPRITPPAAALDPASPPTELERRVAELEKKVVRLTEEVEKLRGKAKPGGAPTAENAPLPGSLRQLALKYVKAAEAGRILDEAINGKTGNRLTIVVEDRTNSVVLRGSEGDLQTAEALLARIDQAGEKPAVGVPILKIYTLDVAEAAAVVRVLEKVFESTKARVTTVSNRSVMVYGSSEELLEASKIIDTLEHAAAVERKRGAP